MIINKARNKSGIVIIQKGRKKNRLNMKDIRDILVEKNYKYLGTIISETGKIKEAIQEVQKKANYIAWKLAPVIKPTSLRFKANMINTFIRPQFNMLAPLARTTWKTDESKITVSYRKIIKKVVGLNKSIQDKVIFKFAGDIISFNKEAYNRLLDKVN